MAAVGDLQEWPGDAAAGDVPAAPKDYSAWQKESPGDNPFAKITDTVIRIVETPKPPRAWYVALSISLCWVGCFLMSVSLKERSQSGTCAFSRLIPTKRLESN